MAPPTGGVAAVEAGLREAAASRGFWLIALAQGSASFANQMLLAHQVASIGTLGLLAVSGAPGWAYLYGALVGVGYAVTAPLMPAVVSDLYRGRNFGTIFGAIQVVWHRDGRSAAVRRK